MAILTYFERIERMDQLIRLKATGPPSQFAACMNLSVSMLYHYLDAMKAMGAPIAYCKRRGSFCYEVEGQFSLKFEPNS
jgi:predicted DNA-binding transcriptional regulator YafY